jgi:hypothetical protein
MTVLALLIDNDIVIKLAQLDAYVDGLGAIGVTPKQVGSLGAMLRFMGLRRRELTRTDAEADRLSKALASIAEIEPTPEEQRLAASFMKAIIEAQLDMDEGEVALMAVAVNRVGVEVATGDKRALRDLPQLAVRVTAIAALRGRLICLEQIFKRLCQARGLPRIRAAVLLARHADVTLTVAYDALSGDGAAAFVNGMDVVVKDRILSVAPNWLKKL